MCNYVDFCHFVNFGTARISAVVRHVSGKTILFSEQKNSQFSSTKWKAQMSMTSCHLKHTIFWEIVTYYKTFFVCLLFRTQVWEFYHCLISNSVTILPALISWGTSVPYEWCHLLEDNGEKVWHRIQCVEYLLTCFLLLSVFLSGAPKTATLLGGTICPAGSTFAMSVLITTIEG